MEKRVVPWFRPAIISMVRYCMGTKCVVLVRFKLVWSQVHTHVARLQLTATSLLSPEVKAADVTLC